MGLLGLFSLGAFTFLFLESVCIAHRLVLGILCPFVEKIWLLVLLGFALPLIYTGVAVALLYQDLIPTSLKV